MHCYRPIITRYKYKNIFVFISMKTTPKGTKKFSKEEKLAIVKEVQENGQKVTLAKYDIYPSW